MISYCCAALSILSMLEPNLEHATTLSDTTINRLGYSQRYGVVKEEPMKKEANHCHSANDASLMILLSAISAFVYITLAWWWRSWRYSYALLLSLGSFLFPSSFSRFSFSFSFSFTSFFFRFFSLLSTSPSAPQEWPVHGRFLCGLGVICPRPGLELLLVSIMWPSSFGIHLVRLFDCLIVWVVDWLIP